MKTMEQLRAEGADHNDEIASLKWYTVAELAKRWRLAQTTVRAIPIDELKFKEFGSGKKLKRRRYRSDWLESYENATGRTASENAA